MTPQYIEINEYGSKLYYKDKAMTILHRENGPAVEYADGSKFWVIDGKRHREDGPAIDRADGTKSWWLNDKEFSEKEFKAELATKQYNKTVQDRGRKGDVEGDFDF